MSFCFTIAAVCAGVLLGSASIQAGTPGEGAQAVPLRVRSVVKASASGRLIRTVVVAPALAALPAVDSAGSREIPPEAVSIPELVEQTAKKYDVDPLLVHSVIQVESSYNPRAVSPKGAQGMMQLMPGTARRFGVINIFDPKENIEGGVRYLKYLQSLFPTDTRLAIAAYNAGEGAVWKYKNQVPPYPETEQYVSRVGTRYGLARKKAQETKPDKQEVAASNASPVEERPAGPVYSPVRYAYDADGRLLLMSGTAEGEVRNP